MGIIVFSLIAMDMEVSEVLVSQVHCVGMIPLQMFFNNVLGIIVCSLIAMDT